MKTVIGYPEVADTIAGTDGNLNQTVAHYC